MNPKILVFVICVKAMTFVVSYNLHEGTVKKRFNTVAAATSIL